MQTHRNDILDELSFIYLFIYFDIGSFLKNMLAVMCYTVKENQHFVNKIYI